MLKLSRRSKEKMKSELKMVNRFLDKKIITKFSVLREFRDTANGIIKNGRKTSGANVDFYATTGLADDEGIVKGKTLRLCVRKDAKTGHNVEKMIVDYQTRNCDGEMIFHFYESLTFDLDAKTVRYLMLDNKEIREQKDFKMAMNNTRIIESTPAKSIARSQTFER